MLVLHQMLSMLVFYFIAAAIDESRLWLDDIFGRVSEVDKNYFCLDINIVCRHRNRIGPDSEIDTKDKKLCYYFSATTLVWICFTHYYRTVNSHIAKHEPYASFSG